MDAALARLGAPRTPSGARAWLIAAGCCVVAGIYLFATAALQGRVLAPHSHDEFMHLLQMQMMARGRLWAQPHPLGDFFESFHIFVRPVYASMYFPGASLFYLPTVWFGVAFWCMPLVAASLSVGLLYRITTHLIDGVAGVLAAFILLANRQFRVLSLEVISHPVMILLSLCAAGAYLCWRRDRRWPWAMGVGGALGWAAITRPADAAAAALPIALATAWDLRRCPPRQWILTAIAATVAAGPFLALQLVQNHGLTGHWFERPWVRYVAENEPGFNYTVGTGGWSEADRPASALPQKQAYYDKFVVPSLRDRADHGTPWTTLHDKLPTILANAWPTGWLLPIACIGVLGLRSPGRWAIVGFLPLFALAYVPFPMMLEYYPAVAAPAAAVATVIGMRVVVDATRSFQKVYHASSVGIAAAVLVLVACTLPEFTHRPDVDPGWALMDYVYYTLPSQARQPAIVLFRWSDQANPLTEPVYNVDAMNPDDEPILRAHDLGSARDAELFRYYAARQPARQVYRFDRGDNTLTDLGPVGALAR